MSEYSSTSSLDSSHNYHVPLSDEELNSVRLRRKREWMSRGYYGLPGYDTFGYQRVLFDGLHAANCRTSLVVMPIGQIAPTHDSRVEHVITLLRGAVEFTIDDQIYHLDPLDQIFLPRNMFYGYRNVALSESYFLNVVSPSVDGWPAEHEKRTYLPHNQD